MAGLYEAPSLNTIKINHFRGIDVSVPEDQVELYRATDALNMIPDAAGQIRKRPGVQWVESLDGGKVDQIVEGRCIVYAPSSYSTYSTYDLYFCNEDIQELLFSCANEPLIAKHGDRVIVFAQQGQYTEGLPSVWPINAGTIQDTQYHALVAVLDKDEATVYTDKGLRYCYSVSEKVGTWTEVGVAITADDPLLTVPLSQQGCDPAGSGTPLEVINLLCLWATESFLIKEKTKEINGNTETIGAAAFHLNGEVNTEGITLENGAIYDTAILSSLFKVEVLVAVAETIGTEESGIETLENLRWMERPFGAGDGYRVATKKLWLDPTNNKAADGTDLGTVWYGKLGPSPLEGEDNVRITYKRAGFRESFIALCKAKCATTYGVAGFKDRLFLGGGDFENRIYYSELEDPLYIGDLNFIELEQGAQVMALSGVADNLVALTQDGIYFAAGQASSGEDELYATDALFTVSNRIPAPAPIEGGVTAILGGEIVYLSEEGVIAVTSKDQYSERYAEHRSATIDKKMLADGPRFLVSFGRYLLIFCSDGICWLLDENQPNTEGNKPYSAHQYEGYRIDGFEADFAYCNSAEQLILTRDGELYQWMEGTELSHFKDTTADAAAAITAYWETPWITGTNFYRNKIFMRIGLLLDLLNGVNSAIRVEGKKNAEDWKILLDYDGALCTFDYGDIDYRYFTYAGAPGNPDIKRKIKVKKATRFKLRFSNDIINQTLILNQCGLDYVQED